MSPSKTSLSFLFVVKKTLLRSMGQGNRGMPDVNVFGFEGSLTSCTMRSELFIIPLADNLKYSDFFLACADFYGCSKRQLGAENEGLNKISWISWTKTSISNVDECGKLPRDRTIMEYAGSMRDISAWMRR